MSAAATKRRKAPECENCFRRRIKCDGRRPECQKCTAKGLKCSGVLDEFDLKFRDQSQTVRKKVEKQSSSAACGRKGKKSLHRTSGGTASPETGADVPGPSTTAEDQALVRQWHASHASPASQIGYNVHLPPGSFATTMFLDGHRSMLGSSGAADPWLAYMRPAIDRSQAQAPLRLAAEAISLAVFSNSERRPEAGTLAIEKYARCISALRTAIADPVEAAADETLMTVLLLTIYEYVTSNDEKGKERFYHHTDGVVAVAVYRRKTGSKSHQFTQMFWVVMTSILMRYTYIGRSRSLADRGTPTLMGSPNRRVSIPRQASVRNWLQGLHAVSKDPGGRLFELMLGTLLLRTKSHDFHVEHAAVDLSLSEEIYALFKGAQGLNVKLDQWDQALPENLRPTHHSLLVPVFPEELESSEIWPGNVTTFADLQAACAHNQWRSLKIMVLCVGLRNLHWLRLYGNLQDHESHFHDMRSSLYGEIDGICASVPYFIGLKQPLPVGSSSSPIPLDGRGALSIAVMLQFCLLVEGIPGPQRRWIMARLRFIADEIGIKYASVGHQTDSACLIFENEQALTATYGGRGGPPLSTATMSVRSASSSPLLSPASLPTTATPASQQPSPGQQPSPEQAKPSHDEDD